MKQSLRSSEWLLICSLLSVIAALALIAQVNARRAFSLIEPQEESQSYPIAVTIEGAVRKPGTFSVPAGTTLAEVLRKARLKPCADIQSLSLDRPLEAPLHLKIEELVEITVFVQGAVKEPVEIVLAAGSRIADLRSKVSLTGDADKAFFRRKRVLKHREVIEVPKKGIA